MRGQRASDGGCAQGWRRHSGTFGRLRKSSPASRVGASTWVGIGSRGAGWLVRRGSNRREILSVEYSERGGERAKEKKRRPPGVGGRGTERRGSNARMRESERERYGSPQHPLPSHSSSSTSSSSSSSSSSSFHPRNGQSVSAKVGCSVGTLPERERHVLGVPAAPTRLPGAGPAAAVQGRTRAPSDE